MNLFRRVAALVCLLVLVAVSVLLTSGPPAGDPRSDFARLTTANPPLQESSRLVSWLSQSAESLSSQFTAPTGGKPIMPKMGNQTLRAALGHSTWHLIHTMGNAYPATPTRDEREAVRVWLRLLGRVYPCGDCAEHFTQMLAVHPPEPHLGSRDALAQYLCKLHNSVNYRLGHAIFDCNKVGDRWKCGCVEEEQRIADAARRELHGDTHAKDAVKDLLEDDPEVAKLDPLERSLLMERNSMFAEDFAKLLAAKRTAAASDSSSQPPPPVPPLEA